MSKIKFVYDAWGNCTVTLDTNGYGTRNPIRYRSYYWDNDLGMYYLMTRYYDPKIGRFINADSLAYLAPETINGLNLYSYCNNNPIMHIDPMGTFLYTCWDEDRGYDLDNKAYEYLSGGEKYYYYYGYHFYSYEENIAICSTKPYYFVLPKKSILDNSYIPYIGINPTIFQSGRNSYEFQAVAVPLTDEISNLYGYVNNFTHSWGGRLNNPATYSSKYGGKYDSFNSGSYVGISGGFGGWGDIIAAFFDDIGVPQME